MNQQFYCSSSERSSLYDKQFTECSSHEVQFTWTGAQFIEPVAGNTVYMNNPGTYELVHQNCSACAPDHLNPAFMTTESSGLRSLNPVKLLVELTVVYMNR
jgi:hypothetical protein